MAGQTKRWTSTHLLAAALAVCAACAVAALVATSLEAAESGKGRATVIGSTGTSPRPNCPTPNVDNPPADKACQAMARVTGFQVEADGRRNPFKVRRPGTIVAWGVDLSKPSKSEQEFFATAIDNSGPPTARLSILKPKGDGRYKLVKQSAVVQLESVLGTNPVFTLTDPLKVRKGMFVALTTTTWVSNLADAGARPADAWLTSREPGQCGTESNDSAAENEADLTKRSRPQQKVGGVRSYACEYEGARILYRAFYVPKG